MPESKVKQRLRMRELRKRRRNPDLPERESKRLPGRRANQERIEELVREFMKKGETTLRERKLFRRYVTDLLIERYRWEHLEGVDEPIKGEIIEPRKRRYSDTLGKMLAGWEPKKGNPSSKLTIRVRKELWDILEEGARKEGMSIPSYSRKLMMDSLTKKQG